MALNLFKKNFGIEPEAVITNGTDIKPFILKSDKPKEISIGMCCGNLEVKGTKYGLEGISKALIKLGRVNIILFGFKKPISKMNLIMNGFKPLLEKLREVYRRIHILYHLL